MWLLKRTVYGLSGPNVVKLVAMEFRKGTKKYRQQMGDKSVKALTDGFVMKCHLVHNLKVSHIPTISIFSELQKV